MHSPLYPQNLCLQESLIHNRSSVSSWFFKKNKDYIRDWSFPGIYPSPLLFHRSLFLLSKLLVGLVFFLLMLHKYVLFTKSQVLETREHAIQICNSAWFLVHWHSSSSNEWPGIRSPQCPLQKHDPMNSLDVAFTEANPKHKTQN